MTETPQIERIILVAAHPGCLAPVFGEAALLRLARMAAAAADGVEVWAAAEVAAGAGDLLGRLPPGVAWRVAAAPDLPLATAGGCGEAGESFLVLPAHSVWDRATFQAALNGDFPPFRVAGREALTALAIAAFPEGTSRRNGRSRSCGAAPRSWRRPAASSSAGTACATRRSSSATRSPGSPIPSGC